MTHQQIQEAFHQSNLLLQDLSLPLSRRLLRAYQLYLTSIDPADLPTKLVVPFNRLLSSLERFLDIEQSDQMVQAYFMDPSSQCKQLAQQLVFLVEGYEQLTHAGIPLFEDIQEPIQQVSKLEITSLI